MSSLSSFAAGSQSNGECEELNGNFINNDHFCGKEMFSCRKKYENLHDLFLDACKQFGQRRSFYSMDFADILCKIQKWRKMLPNVKMFYAVKANNDPLLLRLLVLIDISFDCATEGEIQMVLKAGASPKDILFAHTVKTVEGLLYARTVGADSMSFDCEGELRKIHKHFPEARLLLRIHPSTIEGVRYDLSEKFGCTMAEAKRLLVLAKELKMDIIGVSFHVGALCTVPHCYLSGILNCRELFEQVRQLSTCIPPILDIGGGFFGASGTEHIFDEMSEEIKKAVENNFPTGDVTLIAEPGCFVVGSAEKLVCTIIGKRCVTDASGVVWNHYFVNNSIYGSFFSKMKCYDITVKPLLPGHEIKSRPCYDSIIFGQTCCSEDVIKRDEKLPDLEVGDHLIWENMGAYSGQACTTFCKVPLPGKVYVFLENDELTLSDVSIKEEVRNFIKKQAVCIEKKPLEYTNGNKIIKV